MYAELCQDFTGFVTAVVQQQHYISIHNHRYGRQKAVSTLSVV